MQALNSTGAPIESLGRQLQVTAKAVGERFNQELDAVGLSRPLYLALDQLVREDALRQCDLAARLHVESPTLTHQLDHLAERGLVVRATDAADRRAIRVRITDRGREAQAAGHAVARRLDAELGRSLEAGEPAVLRRLLARIEAAARRPQARTAGRRAS